jgi:hypothetical protein
MARPPSAFNVGLLNISISFASTGLGAGPRRGCPDRNGNLCSNCTFNSQISIKSRPTAGKADEERLGQALGKPKKEVTRSSTEQLHEPRRTSIPAACNLFLSGSPMKPQMRFRGFNSRIASQNRSVPA